MAELNKGGRCEARVTQFTGKTFTIRVDARGHEDHQKEIELPRTLWRGPGAVIGVAGGEIYGPKDPRGAPRVNDFVYYDASVLAGKQGASAKGSSVSGTKTV
jgi:hypothetical protein